MKAGADLHFDGANGTAGGQGPCNLYGGRFEEGAGKVAISGVFATERACPDLETEKAFLAAIEGVSGYGVNRQTDHLSLTGAGGKELLAFEAY